MKKLRINQKILAELIGTFILVFAGCGAQMADEITKGSVTHLGISIAFATSVAALIYTIGHISGCHINPAVTLALSSAGLFPRTLVIPYILAQLSGAIIASFLLVMTFGMVADVGATIPLHNNWSQSLVLETVLTFILMFVITGTALDPRAVKGFAGLAIGLTVGFEDASMGTISGASMNPARSLGPALLSNTWQYHWIYWVGPILGAQLAVWVYQRFLHKLSD